MMTSAEVREKLCAALQLDLIGPRGDSEHVSEVLAQAPSRWYLTGFLVPYDAPDADKTDPQANEEIDHAAEGRGGEDASTPDVAPAHRAVFPSSMGLSFLVRSATKRIQVTVSWGDYKPIYEEKDPASPSAPQAVQGWQRIQRSETIDLPLPTSQRPAEMPIPNSNGLRLALSIRPVRDIPQFEGLVPRGSRSVSVFVVNRRTSQPDAIRDAAFAFQVELEIQSIESFVPRPNLRGLESNDWDERLADLQYRDAFEYAVGHGISTQALTDEDGDCRQIETRWLPKTAVERVAPAEIPDVELGMEQLANMPDAATVIAGLMPLVTRYEQWIEQQEIPTRPANRTETARELLNRARTAAKRIREGIELLANDQAFLAFRLANKVMARSARQRFGAMRGRDAASVDAPKWRPFQLAFILMNLRSIADPHHDDRDVVDLLFFPTGGGKTEAYLGLAAFTLVLRRMKNPGLASAGVSVLMRYTLRLLTLDQLGRASTLICALELERQQNVDLLGEWPFEIGLWVGQAATPNVLGRKGDGQDNSARARTLKFQNRSSNAPPVPIEDCPWCGTKLIPESFRLIPNSDHPQELRITCTNRSCDFTRNNMLPVIAVDDQIYRRLPCFLIATVDKFAAMPWTGAVGMFFGRAERADRDGFYGPCDPGSGVPLPAPLQPPDLIIQDELHLISGPMGTMVGLYETALDELCTRTQGTKRVRPKIIASTATVRRAENQIRALFNRGTVDIFPPPGPDRRDSFFARVHSADESQPRLYLGIAAQGRSLKVILLRTYLALLASAQKWYTHNGGNRNKNNPADPYMTLLGYFNSLRELGGSRRIIEDEVSTRLNGYGDRKRVGEESGHFAERTINYDVVELTSRVSTDKVAEARRKLSQPFFESDHVDVAIATNMISVGLDISRLGLMVVQGQPKTNAEYIQATSRVGRDVRGAATDKPGLVVTILNIHRPRDRSHYERFSYYHETFYRSVEATSVTPFSPRAMDRGLAGTLVALIRQGHPAMTPPRGAQEILQHFADMEPFVEALARRAEETAETDQRELGIRVKKRVKDLLDLWNRIAHELQQDGVSLQYQTEAGGSVHRLLYEFLNPQLAKLPARHQKFRANRSMRDVESSVNLWLRTLDNIEVENEEENR